MKTTTEQFAEFWIGYKRALAFTASLDDETGGNPFGPGPGEFTDQVSDDEIDDVLDSLDPAELEELESDCQDFLGQVLDQLGDVVADRLEEAGADFHFTRNGHGCGFWDGDWDDNGKLLTALAKPYGSAELMAYDTNGQGYLEWYICN